LDSEIFAIFPNPASEKILLKNISNKSIGNNFIIVNPTGMVVHAGVLVNDLMVDISDYTPGIYFIKTIVNNRPIGARFIVIH
jgi:Secretion system C-terminal sorting domain